MHFGHDHDHDHHGNGAAPGAAHGALGHNHAQHSRDAVQWQTPHLAEDDHAEKPAERDIDKVEMAFIDAFMDAPDPTSFLRLAHIPFELVAADGAKLNLLRVEIDAVTDVASLTPHLGGASFRHDPLPANLVSHRRRLRFMYFDGAGVRVQTFAEVRGAGVFKTADLVPSS
jgi:hypothetical protein